RLRRLADRRRARAGHGPPRRALRALVAPARWPPLHRLAAPTAPSRAPRRRPRPEGAITGRTVPVRQEIRALEAYRLVPEDAPPLRAKLDFNESPFDVPEEIRAAGLSRLAAQRWGRYPEFVAPCVKRAIADAIGRRPEEIVVGNGSGGGILAAVSVFAGGGGQ